MAILDQLQALPAQWQKILQDRFAVVIEEVKVIATRAKKPTQSSYNLGLQLFRDQKYDEARLRFKFVLWRQPHNAKAHYYIALCHFALNQKYAGLEALNKSLTYDDKNEDSLYLKATLEDGKYADQYEPHTTPIEMVRAEFAERAFGYNYHQHEKNYRGHELISRFLITLHKTPRIILDAGCGAGICGSSLRIFSSKLTGVDCSPHMIREAKQFPTQSYDEFIEIDLRDHLLKTQANQYDVIASSNVMPIIGGLAPVMDGVANALTNDGYFIFTTYALQAVEGYKFINEIARFAHSSNYIKQQAARTQLKVVEIRDVELYDNDERPAYFVVLQK